MAADGVNKIKVVIVHGVAKHDVTLELGQAEAGDVLTIGHLSQEIEKLTKVPRNQQKLIFKGKSLNNTTEGLASLGIKQGDRIMLLGRAFVPEDDENWQQINKISTEMKGNKKKLSSIIYESDGLHKGHVSSAAEEKLLCQLRRRLIAVIGTFEKLLESLDALQLANCAEQLREKRKSTILEIQKVLDRCDQLHKGLNDLSIRNDTSIEMVK